MGGPVIGAPRVAGSPEPLVHDAPRGGVTSSMPLDRAAPSTSQNDLFTRGGTSPRATTPAPLPPPGGAREVGPQEAKRFLDSIRKGTVDPERWRTAHAVTEGLKSGAITQQDLAAAIREGEGALARRSLDTISAGRDLDSRGQGFLDQGLARGDITPEQLQRATEDGASRRTLESLRRGNGRLAEGSAPADQPDIRRGIERGLFSMADVEAANREGEQRKRSLLA